MVVASSRDKVPVVYAGPPITIDALPQPVHLDLYQGDDFFLDIVVRNDDGTDADLTGWTARSQIRETPDSTQILCTFDIDIEDNIVHLHLPNTESVRLTSVCVWDCQIVSGEIYTLTAGNVRAPRRVTRPLGPITTRYRP